VLKRIAAVGGEVEEVAVRRWNWGAPTGRVRVRTRLAGRNEPVPARLHIRDARGHPAIPDSGQSRFDGQNGLVYFFSPGEVEVELPIGEVEVSAVHGLTTPVRSVRQRLRAGETRTLEIELSAVWDPRSAGWYAGDHHFHLNYGGQYRLEPEDLLPILRGEGMDVATPLVANLHDRFGEQGFWGWKTEGEPPLIEFGQEVRSHFLGHVMLMGIEQLFWPWIWGPGYQVYGADDRTNAQALQHARRQDGMGIYVHPVSRPDPFAQETPPIPLELIPDAVLGDLDGIELVCLWSDELGTAEVWYRILNLGIPVVPTAGTDARHHPGVRAPGG
jgi:TolB protein